MGLFGNHGDFSESECEQLLDVADRSRYWAIEPDRHEFQSWLCHGPAV